MRPLRTTLATLAAAPFILLPGAPAAAHGGAVRLEVAGDGATGVTVRATYRSDKHPVDDQTLRLVLTGTAAGGRTIGPIQLGPAGEGQGFYASGAVLSPGRWRVVVVAPKPHDGRAEATVEARAAQSAPPPAVAAPVPAGDEGGASWWAAGASAVTVAGVAVAFAFRRRVRGSGSDAGH